ncbi:MAG: hypothetical protein AAGE52_26055 [Myxococcota bacterium]
MNRLAYYCALPLLVLACSGQGVEPTPAPTPATVPLGFDGTTTNGETALRNLDDAIASLARAYEASPSETFLAQRIAALLNRASYAGNYDDFAVALDESADYLERYPGSPEAHVTRSRVLSAVHLFREALAELDEAERLGWPASVLERSRITLELAVGTDAALLEPRARALVADQPEFANYNTLATVLANLGRFEEADAMYREAFTDFRDVSPFPVAFSFFARGVMWGEMANRPDLAKPLYEEAVRRLPSYSVGNVHLAELESEVDEGDEAVARLARLAEAVGDPEPAGLLSELTTDPARAAELSGIAAARYDVLLSRHPEAFYDHGSEFFAGAGNDPDRALQLALDNVALRPIPRAFIVAIEAATAAGDEEQVCTLATDAERFVSVHPVLAELVESLDRRCR